MLVISPEELHSSITASMGKNEALLIVDTRPFSDYAEGHVPGAVNIDLMQFHWIDTSMEGIKQFNKQSRILLSNIGASKNKFVVFYDNVSGPSAARGVWLMLYFSHSNVAMLDGGMARWKAKGLPIETRTNPFVHSKFEGKPDPKVLAGYAAVKSAIKKKNIILIDARTREEFDGSTVRAARAGHIPKAINIDWNENIRESVFKGRDDLARLYEQIPKSADIIAYCQGGYRAANTFVVLKMLGYKNVKMYLGSWGEWANRTDLPVVVSK